MMNTRKLTELSLLLAVALILAYFENLLPPILPVPGLKPGLPNLVILLVLARYGVKKALLVNALRLLIISLIIGTFLSAGFYVALAGMLAAWVFMSLASLSGLFSYSSISMLGAAAHNTAQLLAAAVLLANKSVLLFLPYGLLLAIPFGLLTGYIVEMLLKRRPFRTL